MLCCVELVEVMDVVSQYTRETMNPDLNTTNYHIIAAAAAAGHAHKFKLKTSIKKH